MAFHSPPSTLSMKVDAGYRKIYESLRREILDGRYSAVCSFPSSPAQARRFGITRFTVRQALDILTKEELIRSERGRGTFVTKMGSDRQIGLIDPGVACSEFFQQIVTALSGACTENGYGLSIGSVIMPSPYYSIRLRFAGRPGSFPPCGPNGENDIIMRQIC